MYNLKDILNKLTPKKNVLIIGAAIVYIIIDLEQLPKTGEDVTAKSTNNQLVAVHIMWQMYCQN